jgi:glycosyltransferase involved in cell wall biosynthesis
MRLPLISVILPVYNAEDFVYETIQSILDQTLGDFELIIINDGSKDRSEEIILSIEDERIKYVKNPRNLQLINTLNLGLEIAMGKYIARIDADDICLPDRFEKQVRFLEKNSEYGIVGSFAKYFGKKNEILKYVEEDVDIRYALITHNPFIHSTVILRKSILSEFELQYDKAHLHVEDYDLWIRILNYSKGKILPEVLIHYRVHNEQISKVHLKLQLINSFKIQSNYLLKLGFITDEIKIIQSLLNNFQLNVIILLNSMNRIIEFSLKLPFTEKRDFFLSTLQNSIKNQILEKKQLTLNEFFLLLTKKEFSIKQKIAFIFKISLGSTYQIKK